MNSWVVATSLVSGLILASSVFALSMVVRKTEKIRKIFKNKETEPLLRLFKPSFHRVFNRFFQEYGMLRHLNLQYEIPKFGHFLL